MSAESEWNLSFVKGGARGQANENQRGVSPAGHGATKRNLLMDRPSKSLIVTREVYIGSKK